jgi:hypothetical protein
VPRVSRWFVRAALVHLVLGFTVGAALLWNKGRPFAPGLARLLPAHVEFLLVGWAIQLVMGVATWIFPRFGVPRSAYGSAAAAWLAFALLNGGVWAAALGAGTGHPRLAVGGRAAEALAAFVFALNVWPRVRASGLSPM